MASRPFQSISESLHRLFDRGTVTGLGEAELLRRFVDSRDQAAFEAIVQLHGPMVLGLCRRMLQDPRDVDDAFQATFLVLVKKSASIRDPDRLGCWLFGVAHRVARRARTDVIRRNRRESAGAEEVAMTSDISDDSADVRSILDDELARLPEKYRLPLILCYLEGRTHDEAAQHLRWPVGTVRSRMSKGREILRGRLIRRGVTPAAALAVLAQRTASALPPMLLSITLRAAIHLAAESMPAGMVSAKALSLAQGVTSTMFWNQCKSFIVGLSIVAFTAGGATVAARQFGGHVPDLDRPEPTVSPAEGARPVGRKTRIAANQVLVPSADLTKFWIATTSEVDGTLPPGNRFQLYTLPSGTTGIPLMPTKADGSITALELRGGEITEGVAYSGDKKKWVAVKFHRAVHGRIVPIVDRDYAYYQVGNVYYAFSGETGTWDVLDLGGSHYMYPLRNKPTMTINCDNRIHVFNTKLGKWVGFDLPTE